MCIQLKVENIKFLRNQMETKMKIKEHKFIHDNTRNSSSQLFRSYIDLNFLNKNNSNSILKSFLLILLLKILRTYIK
jgi:hypothetical protein